MAAEGVKVRESVITDELYDLIMFLTHSFVQPIDTELYGLKHRNVKSIDEPKSLPLTIQDEKTGFRHTNTMPAAVGEYQRIKARNGKLSGDYCSCTD